MATTFYALQFHIHHIFPTQLFENDAKKAALAELGFTEDATGNKIPLFANEDVAAAVRAAAADGDTTLADAGFGAVSHGAHQGYNKFILERVAEITSSTNLSSEQKTTALFELHKFGKDIALGQISADGELINLKGGTTAEQISKLEDAFAEWRPTQTADSITNYQQAFDLTPIDDNGVGSANHQARYDAVKAAADTAFASNKITPEAYQAVVDHLDKFSTAVSNGGFSAAAVGGQISAAHVDMVYNYFNSTAIPYLNVNTTRINVEHAVAKSVMFVGDFTTNEAGTLSAPDFNRLMTSAQSFSSFIESNANNLPSSLNHVDNGVLQSLGNSLKTVAVGVGGGVIGDAVEFLNISYDSLKKGATTGDWSDFQQNLVEYGAAMVVSAAVIAGTVAVATALSPALGAFAAASFVAWGAVEAVVNGQQLLSKVLNDAAKLTDKLNEYSLEFLEEYLFDQLPPDFLEEIGSLDFFEPPLTDPIVIDLDGDGIELISLANSRAFYDFDRDGFAEHTGWVSPDDAILVIDRNGDGIIQGIDEIFGTQFKSGYIELEELDTAPRVSGPGFGEFTVGDGIIDDQDEAFGDLQLWRDFDGDGRTDEGELFSLSDAGIVSLSLDTTTINTLVEGHQIVEEATVTFADGSTTISGDVFFEISQSVSNRILPDDFSYNPETYSLPWLKGFGELSNSWVSMTEDADLRSAALGVIETAKTGNVSALIEDFDSWLAKWGGVDDVVWQQDVQGLHALFVYDRQAIQEIHDQNPNGYSGLPPQVEGFIFIVAPDLGEVNEESFVSFEYFSSPTSADNQRYYEWMNDRDVYAATILDDDRDFWGFATDTLPEVDPVVILGSSSGRKSMKVDSVIGQPEGPEPAPDMNAQSFAFLQRTMGQDYRLAENFIAPENIIVATPGEDEIPDLVDSYNAIQNYMAARFLVQAAHQEAASTGSYDALGNLTPFAVLGINYEVDKVAGNVDAFVASVIEFYSSGQTDYQPALDLLNLFSEDLPMIPALLADGYPAIPLDMIETTFGVDLVTGDSDPNTLTSDASQILVGLEGDDTLESSGGNTVMLGGAGNDFLQGSNQTDTYAYRRGDGNDTIRDIDNLQRDGVDTLFFTDISSPEVSFSNGGGGDLVILTGDGGSVTIIDHFNIDGYRAIEEIAFADGTWITDQQEIRDRTVADMKVTGLAVGSGLSENYVHNLGDGSYTVYDRDIGRQDGNDTFIFTDSSNNEVTFANGGSDDLLMTLGNGETITIENHFDIDRHGNRIYALEVINFSDGSSLDQQGIRDRTVSDMKATELVIGSELSENYVHSMGDGSYTIRDPDFGQNDGTDSFVFTDVNVEEVAFSQGASNDLLMTLSNSDNITVDNHFDADGDFAIEEFVFADGTRLSMFEINDLLTA